MSEKKEAPVVSAVQAERPKTMGELVSGAIIDMKPEIEGLLRKFANIKNADGLVERRMRFSVFHSLAQIIALEISGGDEYGASGLLDSTKQGFPDFFKQVSAVNVSASVVVKKEDVK